MKQILTPLFIIIFLGNYYAQEINYKNIKLQRPVFNSDSIIRNGIKLHDDKKYDEALIEFEKINENDSSYVLAQYELANNYLAQKKDSMTIEICNRIINLEKRYYPRILLLKANAYDGLKQYKKSEEIYTTGIKEFPLSAKFTHELGISYFNQKKYKEAYASFINALKINPQYAPTHFQLGLFALKQKKIIPAMLSFQYYLLLDNSSGRAKYIINLIEKIGDDAIKYDEWETFEPIDSDDNFSDLEAIVKSKAAFGEKFKSKVKLNFRLLKQIQVVLDKIEFDSADKNFYNQFYGKFFKELADKKLTETYMYYILSDMDIADANKWIKSNNDKVDEFRVWFTKYMRENHSEITSDENLPNKKAYKIYSYNEVSAIGNFNDKNEKIGYWKYFYTSTSYKKSEGAYDNKVERTGPWKYYYEDGSIKEVCSFKNDKLQGEYFKYYPNGKIMNHLFYTDGKFDGKETVYYPNGNIKNTYTYKNDIMNGEEIGYFETGKLKYKSILKEGYFDGLYESFYENGSPYKILNFVKGQKIGQAKEFYNYPKNAIYAEGIYENDFPVGQWNYYYDDGKKYTIGTFNKKGERDGIWKDLNKEGILIKEDTYADGKSEGYAKNYYNTGKIYEEFYYRKNKINLYKYYNASGTLVKEISKQKNDFNFELYNKNGTLRMTGKIIGEDFDGVVSTYDYLGMKDEVKEYKKEQKIKEQYYYSNGQLLGELPIKDNINDGLYTKYFINGNVLSKGYYIKNNMEGYWFYYDKNGPLSEIRYYVNDEQSGWQRTFACNGKLDRAELLREGRVVERCYYDSLENVMKRINYDQCDDCEIDIPNIDGKQWIKRKLKNNYINGISTIYYPNGGINFLTNYDMGLETGVSKGFDFNGKVRFETHYDFNKKQGEYILYKDGKVDYTANYKNGQLSGEALDYYEPGKVYQRANYEFGTANGLLTYYDEAGNVALVLNYKNDDLMSYSYETENGKLIADIEVNKPDMEIKGFYKNKKPSVNFTLKNGEKEGAYTMYALNGMKILEQNYKTGYLNGPRIEYYENGKVKSKCTFAYGDFNGIYTEYYETGIIKAEYTYLNGSRHGISSYYNTAGKILYKYFYYDDYAITLIK